MMHIDVSYITAGGREVDPYPPVYKPTTPAAPKPEDEALLSMQHHNMSSSHTDVDMLVGVEKNVPVVIDDNSSEGSVVPRKGVTDPTPSVIGRKGVGQGSSNMSMSEFDMDRESGPSISTTSTTSVPSSSSRRPTSAISTTSTTTSTTSSPTSATSSSTSASSSPTAATSSPTSVTSTSTFPTTPMPRLQGTTVFAARRPYNDIQKPPTKFSTTEKNIHHPELKPVKLNSVGPSIKADKNSAHLKHAKPDAAVDSIPNKSFSTSVVLGVMFAVIFILVATIFAYKKLQDVWTKRHYDRMDYLIDGMYDL